MEFTSAQIELLVTETFSRYTNFTTSEFFHKDTFKRIFEEVISHGHIFDILLDRGTNNYTRPIEAFSPEEALSLKMLLNDKFDATSILKNALQYKNIRLFFADIPDKDSYYYIVDFTHNNTTKKTEMDKDFYISIILLKDFPTDDYSVQYSIIRDVIELYFAMSFKKLDIPINYDDNTNNEVICFPNTLRSSDFMFMAYYFAYYYQALSLFIPDSSIENTIKNDDFSIIFDCHDTALKIYRDRDKVITGSASDQVDYVYMLTMGYFKAIVQLASITDDDIMEASKSINAASEEEETDD